MNIKKITLILALLALTGSGCLSGNQAETKPQAKQHSEPYITLSQFAKENSLTAEFDPDSASYLIGGTDPIYRIKANDATVNSDDSSFTLPEAPKQSGSELLLSLASANMLLSPPDPGPGTAPDTIQSLSLKQVNTNQLIDYAKKYRGTPYRFNAPPYQRSHKFDCSSFVQHVYGHFGVDLPRSSRAQSRRGHHISRNNLKKGDLLFFYTPGRYRSNQIVGHVGIYIGNDRMINTWGKPGVTITRLTHYWDRRFLFAKRVVQ